MVLEAYTMGLRGNLIADHENHGAGGKGEAPKGRSATGKRDGRDAHQAAHRFNQAREGGMCYSARAPT